ncbi:MAG: DUF3795 domain-containing protein [Candidatus Thorarchaeota archaeon]|jgi:hypothetical protein
MTAKMMAYCGIVCTECNAFIATKNDDNELRKKAANEWSSPDWPVDSEDINCQGCKSTGDVHFKFCSTCGVRACGSQRDVQTCAHCDEYGCDTLEEFLKMTGETFREKLEAIRSRL